MADVVVFPEQFSFDVRVQRSNPRRRLTIKNLGIMAAKLSITMPQSDAFIVTDMKGKTLNSNLNTTMNPDTSYCLFVQKRSTIGIVPEDTLIVSGGKKTYRVSLKPAVSLVSLEELESVTDKPGVVSGDEENEAPFTKSDFAAVPEPAVVREIPRRSRLPGPSSGDGAAKKASKASKDIPDIPNDVLSGVDSFEDGPDPEGEELPIAPPPKLESTPRKQSSIPSRRGRSGIAPEADVLERSLHVKFSFQEDFAKAATRPRTLTWYGPDAFADLQEPDFTLELMMTGEGEDPVFCIDGDYYDASGRLLSVQQGKGTVVYVTQDGYDPVADFDDD
jgi:hypothetical protein